MRIDFRYACSPARDKSPIRISCLWECLYYIKMLRRVAACSGSALGRRGGAARGRSEALREARGRDRSGNADGPLHDLSDFHFVGASVSYVCRRCERPSSLFVRLSRDSICTIDGTAAPVTDKQRLWARARQRANERAEALHGEMVQLHKEWEEIDAIGESAAQQPKSAQ